MSCCSSVHCNRAVYTVRNPITAAPNTATHDNILAVRVDFVDSLSSGKHSYITASIQEF